jgi:hypothetical protein
MWIWKSDLERWEQEMRNKIPKETDDVDFWYLKGKLFAISRLKNKKSPI